MKLDLSVDENGMPQKRIDNSYYSSRLKLRQAQDGLIDDVMGKRYKKIQDSLLHVNLSSQPSADIPNLERYLKRQK